MRYFVGMVCVLTFGVMGCSDSPGEACNVVGSESCNDQDASEILYCDESGVWLVYDRCSPPNDRCFARSGRAICVASDCDVLQQNICVWPGNSDCEGTVVRMCEDTDCPTWTNVEDCADSGLVCNDSADQAQCVDGSGGTGGTGGAAGTGGSGGTGGTGGSGSCAEVDIPGEPNLTGTLSIAPTVASFDEFMTVTVGVDADTSEVTASLLNASSGVPAGFGFASTSGNENVAVMLLVETTAQPGSHILEVELRADPQNPQDYILYAPGDGNTYVRIKVENSVQGPEIPTSCLEVNATIE